MKSYDGANRSFEDTITALGMDYVDLYLIYAPRPWQEMGADYGAGNAEGWRAMEEIHTAGRARGSASRTSPSPTSNRCSNPRPSPRRYQVTYFVGNTQHDITAYCQANGILVEGFSPLATGSILDNADVRAIADWYRKSVATVRRRPPEIRLMPTPQPMPGRRTASPTGQIAAGSRSSGDSVPNTNRDGEPSRV